MPLWNTSDKAPTYFKTSAADNSGWKNPVTGEILVSIESLATRAGGAEINGVWPQGSKYSRVNGKVYNPSKVHYVTGDVLSMVVHFDEEVLITGSPTFTVDFNGTGKTFTVSSLASAPTPVITNGGTPGTTSYDYAIVALIINALGTGHTAVGTAGVTSTGAATLSVTDYNTITWTAVSGATSYQIYRTVGGVTQGLIATTSLLTINDIGLVGDGSTAPVTDTTSTVLSYDLSEYPVGRYKGTLPQSFVLLSYTVQSGDLATVGQVTIPDTTGVVLNGGTIVDKVGPTQTSNLGLTADVLSTANSILSTLYIN